MSLNNIINSSQGPFSNYLLESRCNIKNKKNKHNKMSDKLPNVKLLNSESEHTINIKNNINLIQDSDNESIATAQPESVESTPIRKKKMPTIEPDEFKYFSNNFKQKVQVQKEEEEEEEDEESVLDTASECSQSTYNKTPNNSKINNNFVEKKKQEILIKLIALEKKGVTLTKNYSLKSSMEELEFEYESQKHSAEIEASVHFQQKILMAAVTGFEFLNKKFDPINAKLEGWSESVMDNIVDYEEIFQKLHEKYKSKASMPPELQLFVTLVGSGFMFHLTNSLFKTAMPGLGDALKDNPDIMNNIMGAMGKAMNNAQQPQQQFQVPVQPQPQQFQVPVQQQQQQFQVPVQQQQQQQQFQVPTQNNLSEQQLNMSGPSMNLSSMLNSFTNGPPIPLVQQVPKMSDNDSDRFSVISSTESDRDKNGKKIIEI